MSYIYNEKTKDCAIYTNCKPKEIQEGYKEVTEKEFKKVTEVKEENK